MIVEILVCLLYVKYNGVLVFFNFFLNFEFLLGLLCIGFFLVLLEGGLLGLLLLK